MGNQTTSASSGSAEDLEKADIDTVYKTLETSAKGLTTTEAKARIDKYGRNELVDKEASDLEKFLRFFWGPIACLQCGLGFLAGAQGLRCAGCIEGWPGAQGHGFA